MQGAATHGQWGAPAAGESKTDVLPSFEAPTSADRGPSNVMPRPVVMLIFPGFQVGAAQSFEHVLNILNSS